MTRMLRGRTALFSVLLVLIVVPFAWRLKSTAAATPGEGGEPESSSSGEPPAPDAPAIDALAPLIRCGLDAQALAAAGLSAGQATSIAQNAKAALVADPTHLSGADVAYAAARTAADVLQRKIQSGRATQEEIASYAPIAAIAETKKTDRDAAIDALFGIATQGLAPEAVAKLQTIRANRAAWSAPVEFLVVNRTEKDWVSCAMRSPTNASARSSRSLLTRRSRRSSRPGARMRRSRPRRLDSTPTSVSSTPH